MFPRYHEGTKPNRTGHLFTISNPTAFFQIDRHCGRQTFHITTLSVHWQPFVGHFELIQIRVQGKMPRKPVLRTKLIYIVYNLETLTLLTLCKKHLGLALTAQSLRKVLYRRT